MLRIRPSARLVPLAGLLLAAAGAHAQSVTGVALATASGDSNGDATDSKQFYNNMPATYNAPTALSVAVSLGAGIDARGSLTGQMGTLRASTFAEYPHNGVSKAAQAHCQLFAADALTAVAPGLAFGTPVSIRFLYHLSGTFSTPVTENGGAYFDSATASLQANAPGSELSLHYDNANGTAPYDLAGTLATTVGASISLNYTLDVSCYVNGLATTSTQAFVDFSNTAVLYASAEDSRVTLVAASGHDYAPVPEPAPLAALAMGALAFLRRRGRASARA